MASVTAPATKASTNKESYYTAGQAQLIWSRFKRNRAAMISAILLLFFVIVGIFAPFISPYAPTIAGKDPDYLNGAPQILRFWDENGFSSSLSPILLNAPAALPPTFGLKRLTKKNAAICAFSLKAGYYLIDFY
ncbi:MAG: hypothetical protein R2865_06115 [Deinococcales bacterium]